MCIMGELIYSILEEKIKQNLPSSLGHRDGSPAPLSYFNLIIIRGK